MQYSSRRSSTSSPTVYSTGAQAEEVVGREVDVPSVVGASVVGTVVERMLHGQKLSHRANSSTMVVSPILLLFSLLIMVTDTDPSEPE